VLLPAFVQVCEGETIRGTLSCKPNDKNPRDLDITLEYHFEGKHCEAHRTQVRGEMQQPAAG
jgi:protein arginine N-methyltransferase 1